MYADTAGNCVRDRKILHRIESLVIPPAWTQVWICSSETGHLQAVGRDARGRKQYRYHPLYRAIRDQTKFSRMLPFASHLPRLRKRVEEDLRKPGLAKTKILATIIELLDSAAIRIGNEEYTRQNKSFGLTTLRNEQVEVKSEIVRFRFRGKSGQIQEISLRDPKMSRIVRQLQNLPGQELFLYVGENGEPSKISSEDVNAYLREITGEDVTAKDFRTWKGTADMVTALQSVGPATSPNDAKKKINQAAKWTAFKLGNRPATCQTYYIHPAVTDAYVKGVFFDVIEKTDSSIDTELRSEERAAVALILGAQPPAVPSHRSSLRESAA